jgi:hypothetical protein
MKIFVIEFDNGCQYDDRENYTIGVFDSYEKAEKFCLENGYIESGVKGLFKVKEQHWFNDTYSLDITEVELNIPFNEVKNT